MIRGTAVGSKIVASDDDGPTSRLHVPFSQVSLVLRECRDWLFDVRGVNIKDINPILIGGADLSSLVRLTDCSVAKLYD